MTWSTLLNFFRQLFRQTHKLDVIKASEEKFRLAFDTSPDSIAITRAKDGTFVSVNRGFEQISGYSRDEIIGKTSLEVNIWKYPEDRKRVVEIVLAKGKLENLETVFRTRHGEIHGLMSAAVIELDGEPHILNIVRNITDRKQAEEAMRLAEENYRSIFENALEGIFQSLPEGRFIKVNPAFARMLGYESPQELIETITDIASQTYVDLPRRAEFMRIMDEKGTVTGFEFQMKRKDGRVIWVNESARAVRDGNGKLIYYEGSAEDITGRKQMEQILRESEEKTRLAYDAAQLGIWKQDIAAQTFHFDERARRHFDLDEAQPPLETLASRIHPEDAARFREKMKETGNPAFGDRMFLEYRVVHRDGSTHWLAVHARIHFQTDEGKRKAVFLTGTSQEITERKQAEERIAQAEKRYKALIENAPDGVALIGLGGKFKYASPAALKIFNYKTEDIVGANPNSQTHPEDLPIVLGTLQELIENPSKVATIQYRYKHQNGDWRWIESTFTNLLAEPSVEAIVINFHDITERKQAEEALRKSLHNLEEAERISRVGHYEIDVQSGKATWSQEVFRIFGIDPAEGEPTVDEYAQFIHPQDLAALYEMYARSAAQGTPFDLVYRILRSDGQICHVHSQAETARNEQGQITKLFGTFQDITGQKQAEEKLQNAHEFLQGVQDSLSAHIAILDHEGNIVQVNAAWRGFGYYNGLVHPNHCIGENYLKVCDSARGTDAKEAAHAAKTIRQVIGGEKNEAFFEYACHSPREKQWFIARITSFENSGRKWVVVSHENTTTRRQAEEVLHQRITEMELLYENSLAFTQSFDPKEIAQKIIELLGEKLDWHHTAIRLVNPQDNSLELAAFDEPGLEGENTTQTRLSRFITRIGEGLSGWALQQAKPLRIGDVTSDSHYVESYPGIHSGLYVPLKSGNRAMGVISIESETPNAFSEADEQFIVTLANQAAIAFENARMYREISLHAEELEQRVRERTAEIENTRQRLELAVKTAGLGIWEIDLQSREELWDDRIFVLHGLSTEKDHPSRETWSKTVHPQDLPQLKEQMEQTLKHNKPYNPEHRIVLPGVGIRHIKTTAVVIHDAQGKPARILGADQDITLHKQAEEALLQANAEMQRSLRMKTEFLATMSHELRTPLNSILGISESLEEQIAGALNEKQLKYVRIINESGRHLLELINDILDLSKIEAEKLELIIETVSVEKLCTSSLRIIKELAQKKSLNVSFHMDEKAKYISGDERRLKQILVNLLSNAVKFTPPGKEIGLEVKIIEDAHEISFAVWDQGIGISEEDKKYLFKPFVQLKSGLAREYTGSGLGLALVAQMVRLHGGHITLKSKLNVGSRFTVFLPWNRPNTGQLSALNTATPKESVPDVSDGAKILIVEDTEVVAQLISEYLRHKGYRTYIANDGREGILKAKREHPQIILMDVMMPEMNGMEATKQLRADPAMNDVIIIGLTALAMPSDREQCIAAGMNDHLGKPVQMQELIKIIEHYLQQNG